MSETKHTPGPWEARGQHVNSPEPSCGVAWCGGGSTFGRDGSRVIDKAESEANARLIASAPCMLSALKAMDAALTKGCPAGPERGKHLGVFLPEQCEAWIQIRSAISRAER